MDRLEPIPAGQGSGERVRAALLADVLERFGQARLRVYGSSMLPAVRPGDVLCVRRAAPREVGAGDIVVFARDGRLFAHRVVGKLWRNEQAFLLTCGDALAAPDPPVSPSELLGCVGAVERRSWRVALEAWLRRTAGRLRGALSFVRSS